MRPWIRALAGGAVVAITVTSGTVALGRQSAGAGSVSARAVGVRAPTVALHVTLAPPPVLSQPAPPPGDAFVARIVATIGDISMPTIGSEHTLFEGVDQAALAEGPGHWPGTAEPGGYGNTVIAAHRVSHGASFRDIDRLAPGDPIVVRTAAGTFTYSVTGSRVVSPSELWIVDQHPGRTITLFACHPPGSATQRYVVTGTLTSSVRNRSMS